MASVPIVLNVEQTKRLYKILLPSAIAIVKRRHAERSQKSNKNNSPQHVGAMLWEWRNE